MLRIVLPATDSLLRCSDRDSTMVGRRARTQLELPGVPALDGRRRIPTRPALSPEAARIAQADQQVQRALTASRQVNGLLLKSESEELRRTTEQADALIKEFRCAACGLCGVRGRAW